MSEKMGKVIEVYRTYFRKMARGEIPYTRDFTVVSTSAQVGSDYANNMEISKTPSISL